MRQVRGPRASDEPCSTIPPGWKLVLGLLPLPLSLVARVLSWYKGLGLPGISLGPGVLGGWVSTGSGVPPFSWQM